MQESKKKLVVLTAKKYLHNEIKAFLLHKYNCIFIEKITKKIPIDKVDLILFTGGADIDPTLYGEKKGKRTVINFNRDIIECVLYKSSPITIPKLGICRGAQLLTALSGGKIIQEVTNHAHSHPIKVKGLKNTITVTSSHTQMMYPFNMDNKYYDILGKATGIYSTYKNEHGLSYDLSDDFVEPEIVYYKNTNSLCIQGHPERSYATDEFTDYSYELIEKLLKNEL